MLEEFGPEIWIADGPQVTAALGFHYPTRMAVIRLAGGELFAWSPTALTDELKAELASLGTVRHLIAPNSLHHLFIADWKQAYPDARLYAAPGVQEKRKNLVFDAELSDTPMPPWMGEIDQVLMAGNAITAEVVFFHVKSSTVLFTDLLQQFPPRWFTGWRALVAKWDLMLAPEPSVPRKFRLAFTDRRAARAAVERLLSWPTKTVLMAHGNPVRADGSAFLKRAFRWLTG
ncbi:hypothetical protein B5U98_25720 [Bosea sp. Tri-39]|nr:hypothetical protein B5U98_25720 [Bosea sp. Tri-39]RXT41067.1 hypothetical protein B5U99_03590 [Bosea sp. Tri-54]